MNAAARELGLISAAKARAHILNKAQQMRLDMGMDPSPALYPPLILSSSDRLPRNHKGE